jgi:four helix bundle protein
VARLKQEFLERIELFAHRMVDLAEALGKQRRPQRIVSQIIGCGTSVGANAWEATDAASRPDFCKCLGIASKECSEARFWIRFVATRQWVTPKRLEGLEQEAIELQRIFGTMIARTRTTAR